MAEVDISPKDLARQAWLMYSIGISMIVARVVSQIMRVGWKRIAVDDYMMLLYTALVITIIRSVQGLGGNGFTEAEIASMSPSDIAQHIENAKFVNISEQTMLCTIYSLKACMLMIYSRLTMGLKEQMAVRFLAGYVTVGFIVTEIVMVSSCVPYTRYWMVPVGDQFIDQCAFYQHYSIAQAVFNTTSDAMMLAIPIPLLLRSTLPKKQKVAMVIIFGMGIFVIISAILSKAISLMPDNIDSITYAFWYIREASVAIYVANLPLLWPNIHRLISWISHKTGLSTSMTGTGRGSQHDGTALRDREVRSTVRRKSQRLIDEEEGRAWGGNGSPAGSIRPTRKASNASKASANSIGGILKEDTFEVRITESNTSMGSRAQGFREQEPEYNVTIT
ncbi:hypothetical protein BP5796_05821 [Coleophoma crateriformis]|uniref:Rhodopsin domain-containing protein n=1 Tax=Coleophoma crateriformis TaxID=565419 RepID=A0A3D8RV69_9HELO|nr:hypothetical protein BP5796_05821 [Coleophoma crateriformis]